MIKKESFPNRAIREDDSQFNMETNDENPSQTNDFQHQNLSQKENQTEKDHINNQKASDKESFNSNEPIDKKEAHDTPPSQQQEQSKSKEDEAHHTPAKDTKDQEISLEEQLSQLKKDSLYLRAEIENIKRNNLKERSQLIKYGAEKLARDLVETLDVFKFALTSEINKENYTDFVKGMKMASESLKTTLKKHGIKEVDCLGKAFDPKIQEAVGTESNGKYPEGHITQVFKNPYTYQDKLLRPGQVIVNQMKT